MKKLLPRLLGVVLALAPARAAVNPNPSDVAPFTAREIRQGFRDGVVLAKPRASRRAQADADESREGLRVRRRWERFDGLRLLELPAGDSPGAAVVRLRATGRYEYVQPDSIRQTTATPNDPELRRQWPLANDGGNNGIVGADIKAVTAWDVRTDASNVIVAVIDSGVRYDHPDLAANMWVNAREIPGNGIDDDRDGYIDDVHGINAITNSGDPADDLGHGTHVAGIIGAVGNNGVGMAGVAWRVQIMALKFIRGGTGSNAGYGATSDAVECIEYAIRHGAQIINASYGAVAGPVLEFDSAERDAVQSARNAGIIFVAAAGNDSADMDLLAHYPASYRLDNVVSVASSTARDDYSLFSNFGSGSVDLFAPGSEIYSLWFQNTARYGQYQVLSGTSMAAPHVAGAFALMRAQFPNDTYRQLINRVLRNVDSVPALAGKVQTGGRLNVDRALRSTDNRPFNDDFASRARMTGTNLAVHTATAGATTEAEPALAGLPAAATLWWEWTPTFSATVRVSTDGSGFDTLVGVFTGSALDSLVPVASNDDELGKVTSRLEFSAQAGVTYQIAVGGKNGASGSVLLDIGVIPPNDNFADAQVIGGPSAVINAANAQATVEPGEPRIKGFTGGKSLWYRWTAPASGRFQFAVASDGFDPLLAVYTGSAVNQLTLVGASDNADAERGETSTDTSALVSFNATAGTTYQVQIDGKATGGMPPAAAPFVLTLNDALWQVHTSGSITSAPAIGPDGAVYVGSTDGFFHAFNADGTRRWPAIEVKGSQDTSAAALGRDGTLYFGAGPTTTALNDGKLFAYDSTTGERKWEVVVGNGNSANNAIAIGPDGTLYLHSDQGRIFAYADNGASATLRWSATVPGSSYGSASVAADGTVYIGSDDAEGGHRFYALNPADGSIKWTFTADNPIYTAPAIDAAGNVYFGTLASGRLYSLRADGTQRWVYTGASLGTSSSPALSPDGAVVYFAGYDGILHAVNTPTGTARWTYRLGKEVRASSPAVDVNGVVYVGSYDNLLYAVNANGTLKRTWATGNIVRSSPGISGTTLYIGSNDQRLYALSIGAGVAGPWPQYRHNARRTGFAAPERFALLTPPRSQAAVLGYPITLSVVATGEAPLAYEWKKDDVVISGATNSTLTISSVVASTAGRYTVTISGPQGSITSDAASVTVEPPNPGRLVNLSVRTNAGAAAQTLIVGFSVQGSGEKPLLVRAIGPSLTQFGVTGVLTDPRLDVYSGSTLLTSNDNWAAGSGSVATISATFSAAGAFPLDPASTDAALVRAVPAGSYTAQVSGAAGTGIALAELYDTVPTSSARLVNVSARAQVGAGGGILIAGFTLSGNVPKRVLLRGIGPALALFGVGGTLANPRLDVYRGETRIFENDNWNGTAELAAAFKAAGAFQLINTASQDAALVVELAPGSYTAQLSGVGNTTGVGLIEIYEMP